MAIVIGDIVGLRSGSPEMTVSNTRRFGSKLECSWYAHYYKDDHYTDGYFKSEWFKPQALMVLEKTEL